MDNQYLRPEDLPITDAKKSPLALLAMTCSNIGADVLGAGKSMMAFERNKKSRSDAGDSSGRSDSVNSDKIHANSNDSNRSNSRTSVSDVPLTNSHTNPAGNRISFKPYEDSPKSGIKEHRIMMNGVTGNDSGNSHHQQESMSRKRSSDVISPKRSPGGASSPKRSSSSSSHCENQKNSSSSTSSSSSSKVISYTSTGLLELSKNHQLTKSPINASGSAFPSASQLSHFSPTIGHQNNRHEHQQNSYHSSIGCRDPFCGTCHLSSLSSGLASSAGPTNNSCCNGLSACSHSKPNEHPFDAYPPGLNPLSSHPLNRFSNSLSFPKPFPCHWTANGSYCGKSFSTCEELLQHLKTHTLTSNSPSAYAGLRSYYSQALGAAGMRPYGLEDLPYHHPYKMFAPSSSAAAAFRPPVSLASASSYPLLPPGMSMYPPGKHNASLSSYYALLHGRLAGHGSLH